MAIFMGNSGSLGAVYAGRFIAGLGVGQTVVVGPVYLAEIVSSSLSNSYLTPTNKSNRLPPLSVASVPVSSRALSIWVLSSHISPTMAASSILAIKLITDGYVRSSQTTYITNTDSNVARSYQSAYYLCRPHLRPLLPPARITPISNQTRPARKGHHHSLQNPRPTIRR